MPSAIELFGGTKVTDDKSVSLTTEQLHHPEKIDVTTSGTSCGASSHRLSTCPPLPMSKEWIEHTLSREIEKHKSNFTRASVIGAGASSSMPCRSNFSNSSPPGCTVTFCRDFTGILSGCRRDLGSTRVSMTEVYAQVQSSLRQVITSLAREREITLKSSAGSRDRPRNTSGVSHLLDSVN